MAAGRRKNNNNNNKQRAAEAMKKVQRKKNTIEETRGKGQNPQFCGDLREIDLKKKVYIYTHLYVLVFSSFFFLLFFFF